MISEIFVCHHCFQNEYLCCIYNFGNQPELCIQRTINKKYLGLQYPDKCDLGYLEIDENFH